MSKRNLADLGQITINTDDFTLAELDRIQKLADSGRAGRSTAMAYVWLKREHPATELDDVGRLPVRQVDFITDTEADQDDTDPVGPTSGPA